MEAGIAFAAAMLIGLLIVLSTIAVVTAITSGRFKVWLEAHGSAFDVVSRAISGLAAVLAISISIIEMN